MCREPQLPPELRARLAEMDAAGMFIPIPPGTPEVTWADITMTWDEIAPTPDRGVDHDPT